MMKNQSLGAYKSPDFTTWLNKNDSCIQTHAGNPTAAFCRRCEDEEEGEDEQIIVSCHGTRQVGTIMERRKITQNSGNGIS